MTRPVSVALAVYNGHRHLHEQLATVLADLREDDEVVVVDDASTDHSADMLRAWQAKDKRVRLILRDMNCGVRSSFELAITASLHDIVFLCDQDDRWLAGKRAALVACFERDPECLLAVSDCQVIDAEGRVTADSFLAQRGGFKPGLVANLIRNRYLGCTLALHRRLIAMTVPIPAQAPMHDMWFGTMASLWGNVAFVDKALIQYRRHGANVTTGRPLSVEGMIFARWHLLKCVIGGSVRVLRERLGRRSLSADSRRTL